MKNLSLKLISILIAVFLYFLVHSQENKSNLTFVVPVEIQNLPSDKIILLPSIRQVQVTLKGPSFRIAKMTNTPLAFKVKLPENIDDKYLIGLKKEQLTLPPSVEVVSIQPKELELIFDNLVETSLPVEVPRIGNFNKRIELLEFKIKPERVEVSGPETEVKNIRNIRTNSLDVRNIQNDFKEKLELIEPGKYTRLKVKEIELEIKVNKLTSEKSFKNIPVVIKGSTQFSLSNDLIKIEISGPKKQIDLIKKTEIMPYVEIGDNLTVDELELPIKINLPKNINLILSEPSKVIARKNVE